MTTKRVMVILGVVVAGFVLSCSKHGGTQPNNPPPDCETTQAKFAADISPIIQSRCATGTGCHGSGSANGPGPLLNFNQVKNAAFEIKTAVVSGQMPLGSSLSNAQIAEMSCWVDNGALDN